MFQHLGAGESAVFGDVAYHQHRHIAFLGIFEQPCGAFAHLTHAAGRRVERVRGDGLYRVDHENRGLHGVDVVHDVLEGCLADDEHVVGAAAYAVGSQFKLCGAFLAADVEYGARLDGEQVLKHERALAYAGFTADKHKRAVDEATAQHTVEFLAGH